MVFIGYNYNGKIIGIVNAESKKLAMAFWHGRGVIPHSTKCLDDPEDFTPLDEHPHGVYPILETVEKSGYDISNINNSKQQYFIISKP